MFDGYDIVSEPGTDAGIDNYIAQTNSYEKCRQLMAGKSKESEKFIIASDFLFETSPAISE